MSQRSKDVWRRANIEETKILLRQELVQVLTASDEDQLLVYILKRIQILQENTDATQLLSCFILIIESLRHQDIFGGLSKKQVQDLSTLARSILKVAGVRPRHSPSSFLYTELHAALSALSASQGEPWLALWELEIGNYAADLPAELEARQQLDMGLNTLRMGQGETAKIFFQKALSLAENAALREEIQFQLVRLQRLQGADGINENLQSPMLQAALLWEKTCLEVRKTQDLSSMVALTKKGQPLHEKNYQLELFLYAGCHPKTLWSQKVMKVSSSSSLKKLYQGGNAVLFSIAQSLEMAYDSQLPFPRRLEDIKKIFPKIKLLAKVEHELLIWLYLARWLYRCHHYKLAKVCFFEYESLCKKLSGGESRDLIGLAADMLEIDWVEKAA